MNRGKPRSSHVHACRDRRIGASTSTFESQPILLTSLNENRSGFGPARRVLIMSCWRTLTIIAAAPLISLNGRAYALTLDLPQSTNIASTFDGSEIVDLIDKPLIHLNASGSNDSPLAISTLGDFQLTCIPDYGRPLPVACRFAQRDMPESTRNVSWGDRTSPVMADVSLPFRISSGK